MFDRIRLATVFILIILSNCFSDATIGIPKNQTFLLQLESKLAQNQWIWNSQILSTLSQEFCKLLTAIDVESFARDIGQNDELTEGQKEAFGQLQEIMQCNCREHNQMLGKGSAKEVETVRQHLAQIIIGHGLVVPKLFDPLNIAKLNEAASRVETRRPMKWIERKIISHLVQKLPNGFWLKPTFERILADKGQIASYGLELFQQVWGHFFDAEGHPTSVTEELVFNSKQQQQQKTAFFSSFKFGKK